MTTRTKHVVVWKRMTNSLLNFISSYRRSISALSVSNSLPKSEVENALIDSFGRKHTYLRISLTERCNLRCVYCMPADGIKNLTSKPNLMTLEERIRLIDIFARLGVKKLRLTGGEPTISNQLIEIIKHARTTHNGAIKSVGMTTNGLVLSDKLDSLIEAGLTSVNISLDTLNEKKFASITRRDGKGMYKVLASVFKTVAAKLPVKINCVLMRNTNDEEIADFINLTKANVDVRFIELMPFDGNEWDARNFISYMEVIDRLKNEKGIELVRNLRCDHFNKTDPSNSNSLKDEVDPNDTTKWYRVSPDHEGRVGFITSMSSHFCGGCNRLRVTADGKLKVCLFGDESLSLLKCMREGMSDEEIVQQIGAAVLQKKAVLGGHGNMQQLARSSTSNRPMILIGG